MNGVSSIIAGVPEQRSLDDAVLGLVAVVRHRWRRIAAGGLTLGVLLVVHGARKPAMYPATGGFVAEAPSPSVRLPLPVGVNLRADPITQPFLYTQLLSSNGFLMRVVDRPLVARGADSLSWREIVAGTEGTVELRRQIAAEALRLAIDHRVAPQSGVVTVTVRTGDPAVSGAILRGLLTEISRVGTEVRRQRAEDDAAALENRLVQASAELRDAEQRVVGFRARNRDVTKSAALIMEGHRLDREMSIRRQRYLSVAQEYSDAKANAVRDDPGVIVVNAPLASAKPEPKGLLRRFLMGLITGAGLAAVLTLALDRAAAARVHELQSR